MSWYYRSDGQNNSVLSASLLSVGNRSPEFLEGAYVLSLMTDDGLVFY